MKKFWSGEETRRNGDELFRVKVVGSNPAGPTIQKLAFWAKGAPILSKEPAQVKPYLEQESCAFRSGLNVLSIKTSATI